MRIFNLTADRDRRYSNFVACLWTLLFVLMGCSSQTPSKPPPDLQQTTAPRTLTVAAAADLKFVLGEIITAFETENTEIKVNPTFGSSGSLYSQISNQAPFDLYLSADLSYPQKLIEHDYADQNSLFTYAIGRIVVWAPKASPLDIEALGIDVFKEASIQKIAIANPKHAPYGRAAESALKKLGIYDQIADRLVLGENVAQTAQFIESGAADIGIIAHSLAMAPTMREKGRYWLVPESAYVPLEQGGVIIKWAKEPIAAGHLRTFLKGEKSQAIFKAHGFELPHAE